MSPRRSQPRSKHSSRPKKHAGSGKLRIVGGEWRSRQLSIANVEGLRPTPDRIRETLYNWLTGWVAGARCLDAFSGTGALGLEALSRGASHVTFVEFSPIAAKQLKENLQLLKCTNCEVIQADANQWLSQKATQPYNLIFLDPPFHKGMVAPICEQLHVNGYLAENALVYIESEVGLGMPDVPSCWAVMKEKTAGQVTCRLFQTGD